MLKWCFQVTFPPCHYCTVHTGGCFRCKSRQPSAAWVPRAGTTAGRALGRGVCLPGTDWSPHVPQCHCGHTRHHSATQGILINPIPYGNPREYITTITFLLSSLAKATGFPVISASLIACSFWQQFPKITIVPRQKQCWNINILRVQNTWKEGFISRGVRQY